MIDSKYWKGRRVLLTGHTGFKGGWLALWLQQLGATVCGIALAPTSNPNLYNDAKIANGMISHYIDLRDAAAVKKIVHDFLPEIVFHLALSNYQLPLPYRHLFNQCHGDNSFTRGNTRNECPSCSCTGNNRQVL
jgi:FlaA1/EpsC-like NDP-sugar epimerase